MPANRRSSLASVSLVVLASLSSAALANADVVIDWNRYALNAIRIGGGTAPRVFTSRYAAIVHVAMFNAVNGIEGRYEKYDPDGSLKERPAAGASKRAAAAQAAHDTLRNLFPAPQLADLDAQLTASLASIKADKLEEGDVAAGIAWGKRTATHAWDLRKGDDLKNKLPYPYGGMWQPTQPNPTADATAWQLADFNPWVMGNSGQFLGTLPGPPALTSGQYAADFNETRTTGRGVPFPPKSPFVTMPPTSTREQRIALFWHGDTALYWNRIAGQASEAAHLSLTQNARLFALLNIAMADAAIACWNAKYHFEFWRPITAITLTGSDPADKSWTPYLVVTPAHPEYPSGHSTVSGAAVAVLGRLFGDGTSFSVDSELLPGVIRSFKRFSDALAEIHDARVWGGIHFRSACRDGSIMGQAVGALVLSEALRPVDQDDNEDDSDHGHRDHDHR